MIPGIPWQAPLRDSLLPVIVGPTGSGKTSLSLALAEALDGEIVSCDSVAVYRDFEIGTAKPLPADRRRIAHHLIDVAVAGDNFTAGDYSRVARKALADITARGKLPIVVGGTGLYLRALLLGLSPAPPRVTELRGRLQILSSRKRPEYLHRMLRRMDVQAAANIHPNDIAKIIRAIEVCMTSRQAMTELWKEGRETLTGFRILRMGLAPERTALYERINARAGRMFDEGLVEETRMLLQKYGDAGEIPLVFNSLGYKQAVQVLHGDLGLAEAVAEAQQAHRNYAKRQMTWFRREPDVRWFSGFGDDPEVQRAVVVEVSRSPGNDRNPLSR